MKLETAKEIMLETYTEVSTYQVPITLFKQLIATKLDTFSKGEISRVLNNFIDLDLIENKGGLYYFTKHGYSFMGKPIPESMRLKNQEGPVIPEAKPVEQAPNQEAIAIFPEQTEQEKLAELKKTLEKQDIKVD